MEPVPTVVGNPWGLELTGLGFQYGGIKANRYLYQGKEMMDDLNLGIYDFHARGYDPVIGRTWQQDPHADNYYALSPYSWVANNPLSVIDPTGMDTVNVNNLDMRTFNPDVDVVGLDEVTVTASYTGPKASDSPNVRFAVDHYYSSDRPLATGAVEPIYLTPNPVEAVIGVTDNLSRGEMLMAGMAGIALIPGGKTVRGVVKAVGLPISGKIRFIPRTVGHQPNRLPKGQKEGSLIGLEMNGQRRKLLAKALGKYLGMFSYRQRENPN